jgi:glucan phosphoethanolaminetransferase (alkaline phosphatase superfamily)
VAYLYGLLIVALLSLAIHYFTELKTKQKLMIAALLLIAIFGAVSYNKYQDVQREKMLEVIVKYKQGKTIHCNGREVNASTYSLSIGTYTFIGKKNTPHYAEMIDAYQCQ